MGYTRRTGTQNGRKQSTSPFHIIKTIQQVKYSTFSMNKSVCTLKMCGKYNAI